MSQPNDCVISRRSCSFSSSGSFFHNSRSGLTEGDALADARPHPRRCRRSSAGVRPMSCCHAYPDMVARAASAVGAAGDPLAFIDYRPGAAATLLFVILLLLYYIIMACTQCHVTDTLNIRHILKLLAISEESPRRSTPRSSPQTTVVQDANI